MLARRSSFALASLFACAPLALAACSSSAETGAPADATKLSLGKQTVGDVTVELLTDRAPSTGLTPIWCRLTAGGAPVTDATVSFLPIMTMSGMTHSAPVLGAATRDASGDYATSVVFQMASSDMDVWSAKVSVTRPGQAAADATFSPLTVTDSGRAKTFAYTAPGSSMAMKYVASLNFAGAPKVGLNPAVVTLHRMKDMMSFEEVADATLTLDPQMPSMGHGSPGTVQPTKTTLGRYDAQVSFSMPGTWETKLTVASGGATIGTVTFTTTF
jgi:hypothetical protein